MSVALARQPEKSISQISRQTSLLPPLSEKKQTTTQSQAPGAEDQVQTPQQPTPTQDNGVSSSQQQANVTPSDDPNATVASIEIVDVGNGWQECQLNFSDGSVHRRTWKMVRNGVVEYEGKCDDSLVGTPKSVN